jgi:hypothetical protein
VGARDSLEEHLLVEKHRVLLLAVGRTQSPVDAIGEVDLVAVVLGRDAEALAAEVGRIQADQARDLEPGDAPARTGPAQAARQRAGTHVEHQTMVGEPSTRVDKLTLSVGEVEGKPVRRHHQPRGPVLGLRLLVQPGQQGGGLAAGTELGTGPAGGEVAIAQREGGPAEHGVLGDRPDGEHVPAVVAAKHPVAHRGRGRHWFQCCWHFLIGYYRMGSGLPEPCQRKTHGNQT